MGREGEREINLRNSGNEFRDSRVKERDSERMQEGKGMVRTG
jgi:hypothetical protein